MSHSGASVNPYRYTGQQFDALTGLYSLRARYYDPALGRFLSRDPAEPLLTAPHELNRYVYVADNPLNAADPSGRQALTEYSMANEQSRRESAATEPVGQTTADLYGEALANEQIAEAQSLYSSFFSSGDNVAIAKGTYVDMEGNIHNFVGTNDFYGSRGWELYQRIISPGGLQQSVGEFIPVQHFSSPGDALHVEFKVIQYFENLVSNLPANFTVVYL